MTDTTIRRETVAAVPTSRAPRFSRTALAIFLILAVGVSVSIAFLQSGDTSASNTEVISTPTVWEARVLLEQKHRLNEETPASFSGPCPPWCTSTRSTPISKS
jgi:hypothetical protein